MAGELPVELIGTELAPAGTAVGEVLRGLEPERLPDLSSRVRHGLDPIRGEARSALLAPLVFRGRAMGILIALEPSHEGSGFDEDDEYLLASFAAAAVIGIATAQSVEADRLRHSLEASEQERRRWARELHDETLQDLGALKMILQSGLSGPDADRLRQAAEQAVDQADLSISALQGLITELRPAALDELGLTPALEALVERIRTVTGLEVELELDVAHGRGRLASEVEDTAYRLVQEALSNVVKHAGAERVQVAVVEVDGSLNVSVRDDGGGFDPRRTDGGYGLIGMRERVALLDGTLAIDSRPDAGCTVRPVSPPSGRLAPVRTIDVAERRARLARRHGSPRPTGK